MMYKIKQKCSNKNSVEIDYTRFTKSLFKVVNLGCVKVVSSSSFILLCFVYFINDIHKQINVCICIYLIAYICT